MLVGEPDHREHPRRPLAGVHAREINERRAELHECSAPSRATGHRDPKRDLLRSFRKMFPVCSPWGANRMAPEPESRPFAGSFEG